MTGFRRRRGDNKGRNGRQRSGRQWEDIYTGDHANDFPCTIGLSQVIRELRQPRQRYSFKEETMVLKFQDMTLSVHGCADHAEGKRVAADIMLNKIYPEHKLNATSIGFHDAHEIQHDKEAWDEVVDRYNKNRETKRVERLEEIKNAKDLDDDTKFEKIQRYENNYAIRDLPKYNEIAEIGERYLARRGEEKKRKPRRNRNANRMSSGESSPVSKDSDVKASEADSGDARRNARVEDPEKRAYHRLQEMLIDVSRVQNKPYAQFQFERDGDAATMVMTFEKEVITMKGAADVNLRGIVSDIMLSHIYPKEHVLLETTKCHDYEQTIRDLDWDAAVAECRKNNEVRVNEKLALLEQRKENMTEEAVDELRSRYELWLKERPCPTYAELCERVDERLARKGRRRTFGRRRRSATDENRKNHNASGDGKGQTGGDGSGNQKARPNRRFKRRGGGRRNRANQAGKGDEPAAQQQQPQHQKVEVAAE